eukprot:1155343-Pelagomonas_calceolata.AAC.1
MLYKAHVYTCTRLRGSNQFSGSTARCLCTCPALIFPPFFSDPKSLPVEAVTNKTRSPATPLTSFNALKLCILPPTCFSLHCRRERSVMYSGAKGLSALSTRVR